MRRNHRADDRPDLCDAVRQAVSASFDDESPGLRAWTRRAHLRRCPECRRFEAGVQTLTVPMFLDGSRLAPDGLKESLAGALIRPDGSSPAPGQERGRRPVPRLGWRRPLQWAGALVPTVALGVLLPLGAFSAASGRPTHASTPCTVNVHHAPRPSARRAAPGGWQDTDMADERIEVQRTIAAEPGAIFAVLSDPKGHVTIDSSGMLMSASGQPVTEVGDEFVVHMDREALNDYPMGLYDVTVTIVTFEPDREIAWTILGEIRPAIGHVYGYTLAPVEEGTLVTSYYDWSSIDPVWKEANIFPVISEGALRATLGILARTVTAAP